MVIHSPGAIDMEAWIDHPNVTAVIMAGFPGKLFAGMLTYTDQLK